MSLNVKTFWLGMLSLALPGAMVVNADTISPGGTWQSWSATNLYGNPGQTPGSPYWNNNSGDGPAANIGWCLTGGGLCNLAAGTQGALSYYGGAGGTALNDLFFTSTGPSTVSFQVSWTAAKTSSNTDVFGYYLTDSSGAPTGALHPLLTSTSSLGATSSVPLSAGQNYGFYIENIQGPGTPLETDYIFYMDGAANSANGSMPADNMQHFAVFQSGSSYFLGTVGADACQNGFVPGNSPCVPANLFDFNDVVVEVTPGASMPEPASLGLLGGGLALLGLAVRKSRFGVAGE